MNKFDEACNMILEVYLNEPFGDKYDLNKIKNWGEKFLREITGVNATSLEPEKKLQYSKAAKTYQSMMPLAVEAINDLYTAEYKLHLLNTQYKEYINKFNIPRITHSLVKICDFLKEFILTNMCSKWIHVDKPVPTNISAREYFYNKYIFNSKYRGRPYSVEGIPDEDEVFARGIYSHRSNNLRNLLKKIDSNDINEKIVGVTMLLNIFHDDNRGLVIAQPTIVFGYDEEGKPVVSGEEYPEIIIPLDKYEKASKINHKKVEKELKQEIFGY